MDPLREELKKAFALDDAMREDFEQWQAQYAPVHKHAGDEGLVFKTLEMTPVQQQGMDPVTEEKWNRWCEAHIAKALADAPTFTPAQIEVMGQIVSELRKQLRDEFNRELGSLRADLTLATALAKGEISQLKKGKTDAA
jgi:hypothetical protein